MKKFFGFGSSTPPPPPPPSRPPSPPNGKGAAKAAPAAKPAAATSSIVGQWKDPNGKDVTEFHADGTVVEKPASGETIRGRYSIEGQKLKVKLDGLAEELSFTAVIKTDELEMKDQDGQATRYRRV
jgi:uncharacterized protein (TIGR03066 family)